MPKTNVEYWREKLTRNVARDHDTDERLRAVGWQVLRFYEHTPPSDIAAAVASAIQASDCALADGRQEER